jgi:hypothetical protein
VPFPDARFSDLQEAVNFAIGELPLDGQIAVEIAGSQTLILTAPLAIDLPAGTTLELRAAANARPTLLLDGEIVVAGDPASTFILNGLVIAAGAGMTPGLPAPEALVHLPVLGAAGAPNLLHELDITHCTLVPGWSVNPDREPVSPEAPGLLAETSGTSIVVTRSIVGAIYAAPFVTLNLTDSIIDATDPTNVAYAAPDASSGGGALTMDGCTVIGKVHSTLLSLVSNSIFWGKLAATDKAPWVSALVADRKQEGCVRFSFLPVDAVTPRRFNCVELTLASPQQPLFFALRYGSPAYAKLLISTDNSIRRGAEDGGEMGAFHFLLAPQRESDLQIRLQEYLPVGLESGLIYQN